VLSVVVRSGRFRTVCMARQWHGRPERRWHSLVVWAPAHPVGEACLRGRQGGSCLGSRPLVLRCSALRIRQHVAKLWERSHVELPCLEEDVGLLVFGPAEEEHDPAHVGRQRRSAAHDQVTRQPRDREHG
jgi:hypothetical protein